MNPLHGPRVRRMLAHVEQHLASFTPEQRAEIADGLVHAGQRLQAAAVHVRAGNDSGVMEALDEATMRTMQNILLSEAVALAMVVEDLTADAEGN